MPQLPLHDAGASCSLDEHDAKQRNAEFADVVARGLRHRERPSDYRVRLVFENRQGLGDDIRQLARRESQCCGFFSFDLDTTGENIVLQVTAPPDKFAYLDALYEATDPDGTFNP